MSFHPGYKPVAVGPQGNGPQEFRQQFPCPTQDPARVILAGPIRSSPIAGFSSIQAVRGRFLPGFAVESALIGSGSTSFELLDTLTERQILCTMYTKDTGEAPFLFP